MKDQSTYSNSILALRDAYTQFNGKRYSSKKEKDAREGAIWAYTELCRTIGSEFPISGFVSAHPNYRPCGVDKDTNSIAYALCFDVVICGTEVGALKGFSVSISGDDGVAELDIDNGMSIFIDFSVSTVKAKNAVSDIIEDL